VRTYTTCSWCHTENPLDQEFCKQCGHYAHKPRVVCTCSTCNQWPHLAFIAT
jgi:hypothetical protein